MKTQKSLSDSCVEKRDPRFRVRMHQTTSAKHVCMQLPYVRHIQLSGMLLYSIMYGTWIVIPSTYDLHAVSTCSHKKIQKYTATTLIKKI
jgi:hypothetical protein